MSRLSVTIAVLAVIAASSACSRQDRTAGAPPAPDAAPSATAVPDAAIRKALAQRVPQLPKIDEITRSPIPGLYEVRYGGTEIIYTDAQGDFVLQGAIIDTRTMTNLTEARIDKITAVDWKSLQLKDALVYKQGDGSRKLAVFVDPNCGYCKRFERDLLAVKDVTIYAFLMPILGPDSLAKSKDIWCAADAPKAWRAWMIDGVAAPKAMGTGCDVSVLDRNVEFGRKHRINGTPGLLFEDGTRKAGALPVKAVEELLVAAAKKS